MLVIAFVAAIVGATPAQAAGKTEFGDVPASAKFYTEISWLADQQVTTGYSDDTFHPTESASREAFAAFLYRLAGKPSVSLPSRSPFKDVKTSAQFYKEIVWLSKKRITTGWPDGTFRPKINVSREAIAAFLYRGDTKLDRDGTYKVGSEIKPGTYTALVAGSKYGSGACYWERRDRNGDYLDGILANKIIFEGRTIITILPGDRYFQLSGCSGLTPLRKTAPSASTVGDGMHAVGYHMKSGTYSAYGSTGDDYCYWAKVSGFTGDSDEIIENDFIQGKPSRVTVSAGQGFESSGCGTWRRISS